MSKICCIFALAKDNSGPFPEQRSGLDYPDSPEIPLPNLLSAFGFRLLTFDFRLSTFGF